MSELAHRCHFPGCKEPTPRKRLFCKPHWFMAPVAIRDRVWAAYNKLPHGPDGKLLRISDEWLQAVQDAEEAIRAKLAERASTELPL
jgi:hypothetical protein